MNKKLVSALCIATLFFSINFPLFNAKAQLVVATPDATTAIIEGTVSTVSSIASQTAVMTGDAASNATNAAGTTMGWGETIIKWVKDNIEAITITASKMAALLAVQAITQAIIGSGGGGVITDYNHYLFIGPQQRAMAQMNTFFNTVSRGRLSSLNYEGVGPNYDAYLVAQARQSISGLSFQTNLQEQATNPTQLFSSGNMKGIMSYMQCANNVACYTLTSVTRYNYELSKATEIAKAEQTNGFLPVKKNGKITQPSAIVASALSQIDQLGTQVIMNADAKAGIPAAEAQIATGAGINIAARSLNYLMADSKGRDAIRNSNDQFPFSASYSLNGGVGISAGGVTSNSGIGAIASQTMIGNTCATAAASIDGGGATVTIQGRKYDCATKKEITASGPSATINAPRLRTY